MRNSRLLLPCRPRNADCVATKSCALKRPNSEKWLVSHLFILIAYFLSKIRASFLSECLVSKNHLFQING